MALATHAATMMENVQAHQSAAVRIPVGRGHENQPLRGYLTVAGVFASAAVLGLGLLKASGRRLPVPKAIDVFLLGIGTMRLSRLIARDKVMSPVRAPFTDVEQDGAETKERPRGSGITRAVGELVTCPRCTAMWASGMLCMTYCWTPDVARAVSLTLSSAAISDVANRAFAKLG